VKLLLYRMVEACGVGLMLVKRTVREGKYTIRFSGIISQQHDIIALSAR
jgi:hypothetical protein